MRAAGGGRKDAPSPPKPPEDIVPGLTFRLIHDNRIGVFGVNGSVSIFNLNNAVLRASEAYLRHKCHVIVDFTNTTALHEARIGFLAYGRSFLRKRGNGFALVAPRRKEVFRDLPVDMTRTFDVYATVEEAARALLEAAENAASRPARPRPASGRGRRGR